MRTCGARPTVCFAYVSISAAETLLPRFERCTAVRAAVLLNKPSAGSSSMGWTRSRQRRDRAGCGASIIEIELVDALPVDRVPDGQEPLPALIISVSADARETALVLIDARRAVSALPKSCSDPLLPSKHSARQLRALALWRSSTRVNAGQAEVGVALASSSSVGQACAVTGRTTASAGSDRASASEPVLALITPSGSGRDPLRETATVCRVPRLLCTCRSCESRDQHAAAIGAEVMPRCTCEREVWLVSNKTAHI